MSSYRNHRAGSSQSGGSSRGSWQQAPSPGAPAPALGPLIQTLRIGDISATKAGADPVITDCAVAASYNWVEAKEPTILVPGTYEGDMRS